MSDRVAIQGQPKILNIITLVVAAHEKRTKDTDNFLVLVVQRY
jgi:hypothetical protein